LFGPTVLATFVERYDWSYAPILFVVVMIVGSSVAWLLGAVLRRRA